MPSSDGAGGQRHNFFIPKTAYFSIFFDVIGCIDLKTQNLHPLKRIFRGEAFVFGLLYTMNGKKSPLFRDEGFVFSTLYALIACIKDPIQETQPTFHHAWRLETNQGAAKLRFQLNKISRVNICHVYPPYPFANDMFLYASSSVTSRMTLICFGNVILAFSSFSSISIIALSSQNG